MNEVKVTPSEWEIMRVVWTQEKTTSKEINEVLADEMEWKPATVKTLIGRLVKKGMLDTEKEGRKFIYSPIISEDQAIIESGQNFLDQICNRKTGQALADLIATSEISQSDIAEMESLLQEKKKTAPVQVECKCLPGQCDCKTHFR